MDDRRHIIVDDEPSEPAAAPAADEPLRLDPRRVRAVALERRAADAARTRRLVIGPVCAALAIASAAQAALAFGDRPTFATACAAAAAASAVIGWRSLAGRAGRSARDADGRAST